MKDRSKVWESLIYPTMFVVILWVVKITEMLMGVDLGYLGILPRTIPGMLGIFTAPLIHGDLYHLYSNTLPLLILGMIIVYFYNSIAFEIFFWVYFMTGTWVWAAANGDGYHIGASGLIYGFVSFLFFSGLFRNDKKAMALSLLVTFVYGGLVWGLFPFSYGVSWESHFFGALAGCLCAWFYRKSESSRKATNAEVETNNQSTRQPKDNP
ncbi:MAG TPA: rhomboid family intramembrane serine protease [Cytophagaceae bacterium]